MKDNITHRNISNHLRELNYGTITKDDDTDMMEEDPISRKKNSRESNKRVTIGRTKKRTEFTSHNHITLPQYLRGVDPRKPAKQETKLQPRQKNELHMITRIKGK